MRLALVCSLLIGAACTAQPPPAASDAALVVGTTSVPNSLDPPKCNDEVCAYAVLPNTHDGLTAIGPDLAPVPSLARRWTVSDDGTTYTFEIDEGVMLHDGTTVDAEVVAASLRRAGRLAAAGSPGSFLAHGGVTIDARSGTVVVRLPRPDASLPARLAFAAAAIVSPAVYPSDASPPAGEMAGSGPYTLDQGTGSGATTLVAVADDPPTREVAFRVAASTTALRADLERGRVHVAFHRWGRDDLEAFAASSAVGTVAAPGPGTRFIAFNVAQAPFDDVSVRRAVASAIDRSALVDRSAPGVAEPLDSLVPAGFAGAIDAFAAAGASDVDGHLSAAGFGPDEVVDVDLWYTPAHYGEGEGDAAATVAEMLEDTDRFRVTVRTAEWPDYQGGIARSQLGMFLLGWFPDFLDAAAYLDPFLHSATTSAIGSNYADDTMDTLLDDVRTAITPETRAAALSAVQRKVAEDVPYIPLWRERTVLAYHGSVSGVALEPAPYLRLDRLRRG